MASLTAATPDQRTSPAPGLPTATYLWCLTAVGLLALAIRVGFVLDRWHVTMNTDQFWYQGVGLMIAGGKGISNPFAYLLRGWLIPTGQHAPLAALLFVPWDVFSGGAGHAIRLGWTPDHSHQIAMAVLGAATAVLLGVLAGRLVDRRAGVVTALVAACYPGLWFFDSSVMSEPVEQLTVAVTLLVAYRLLRRPSWRVAALLGLLVGLDMLARVELALLVPLLLLPVCVLAFRHSRPRLAIGGTLAALVVAALVVAPWAGYMASTFGIGDVLSTESGYGLAQDNNPLTYYGKGLGYWYPDLTSWHPGVPPGSSLGEAAADKMYRQEALRYIGHHTGRLPVVLAARFGRMWFLYRPFQHVDQALPPQDKWHDSPVALTAWIWSFYLLFPFAAAGIWLLRRRRVRVYPLTVPVIIVTVVALGYAGVERYRAVFEDVFVVAAGVGLFAVAGWLRDRRDRRHRRAPDDGRSASGPTATTIDLTAAGDPAGDSAG